MKKKWLAAVIIYVAALIICIAAVYVIPSLKGMLEKTYVTEFGKIDIADDVSAFIVRDETVYVAAQDCEISRVASENTLLKANTRVVEMTAVDDGSQTGSADNSEGSVIGSDNISRKYLKVMESLGGDVAATDSGRMGYAGYVSYFVDGAEAKFSTGNIANLRQSDYESLKGLKTVETPDDKCGKGDPVFKVTHNSKWYLVFYIDNKAGEKYYAGRSVYVNIAGNDEPAKVASVQTGKKTTKVVLRCKTFFEGFAEMRTMDTTVTVASAEGLVLQDSSIVMKGEQKGVLVKNKLGEHKFKPISIKADDGERCVVYSDIFVDENGNFVETLKTYDEIVAEPTEEEIAELQEQAKREAEEAKKKAEEEERRKAEEEKQAAEREAAEKAAAEARAAEEAKAAEEAQQAAGTQEQPAPQTDGSNAEAPATETPAAEPPATEEQTPPAG